jgi:hypothetical protein
VIAIRGNIDKTGRAADLPGVQGLGFLGHSHKPGNAWIGDVLYFNSGAAGPRCFSSTLGKPQRR